MGNQLLIKHEIIAAVGLSTLASRTFLTLSTGMSAFENRGFLLKRIRGGATQVFTEPGDVGILVMAYGDASASEIETALEAVDVNLTEDELVEQASARRIISILHPTIIGGVGTGGSGKTMAIYDFSDIEIPAKGLPFPEGVGWKWGFYNIGGGAFTTGSSVMTSARVMGVALS